MPKLDLTNATAIKMSGGAVAALKGAGFAWAPAAPPSGFDPATLFAASEQGVWIDPSDLTTLFQDTAATTPVTADGQAVAYLQDKSGNANHITVSDVAKRPLYKTDGTLHWLQMDGVDDVISSVFSIGGVFDYCLSYVPSAQSFVAFHRIGGTGTAYVLSGTDGSTSTNLNDANGTINATYFDDTLSAATTRGGVYTNAQASRSLIVNYNLTSPDFQRDRVSVGHYAATFPKIGNIYGLLVRAGTMDATQRTNVATYHAAKTGRTL